MTPALFPSQRWRTGTARMVTATGPLIRRSIGSSGPLVRWSSDRWSSGSVTGLDPAVQPYADPRLVVAWSAGRRHEAVMGSLTFLSSFSRRLVFIEEASKQQRLQRSRSLPSKTGQSRSGVSLQISELCNCGRHFYSDQFVISCAINLQRVNKRLLRTSLSSPVKSLPW